MKVSRLASVALGSSLLVVMVSVATGNASFTAAKCLLLMLSDYPVLSSFEMKGPLELFSVVRNWL